VAGALTVPAGPPFRAEHIGSLLRPERLMAARRRLGEIGSDALAAAEAEAIADAVKLQQAAGLAVVTDGEFRRASYHSYFYSRLGGRPGDIVIDTVPAADAADGHGRGAQPARVGKGLPRCLNSMTVLAPPVPTLPSAGRVGTGGSYAVPK
jgi:hypothetical protein